MRYPTKLCKIVDENIIVPLSLRLEKEHISFDFIALIHCLCSVFIPKYRIYIFDNYKHHKIG